MLDYAGVRARRPDRPQQRAAARPGRALRRQHGRRARAREDGRGATRTSTGPASRGSAGPTPDSVFYYRIHSPVILIEFDHQRPVEPAAPGRESDAAGRASTSTPSCARRTATTTARICCGSTTSSTRTRGSRDSTNPFSTSSTTVALDPFLNVAGALAGPELDDPELGQAVGVERVFLDDRVRLLDGFCQQPG